MPPNVGIVTFIVLMYQSWCLWNGSLALWPNWIRHQTSDLGIAGSSPVTVGETFSFYCCILSLVQEVLRDRTDVHETLASLHLLSDIGAISVSRPIQ